MFVGSTTNLTATVLPTVSTDEIVWTTSDETIATVVDGKVTCVGKGTVSITATSGGHSDSCVIVVVE